MRKEFMAGHYKSNEVKKKPKTKQEIMCRRWELFSYFGGYVCVAGFGIWAYAKVYHWLRYGETLKETILVMLVKLGLYKTLESITNNYFSWIESIEWIGMRELLDVVITVPVAFIFGCDFYIVFPVALFCVGAPIFVIGVEKADYIATVFRL